MSVSDTYGTELDWSNFTTAYATTASAGDKGLVAPPGANEAVVWGLIVIQNNGAAKETITLKYGMVEQWQFTIAVGEMMVWDRRNNPRQLPPNTPLILHQEGNNALSLYVEFKTPGIA